MPYQSNVTSIVLHVGCLSMAAACAASPYKRASEIAPMSAPNSFSPCAQYLPQWTLFPPIVPDCTATKRNACLPFQLTSSPRHSPFSVGSVCIAPTCARAPCPPLLPYVLPLQLHQMRSSTLHRSPPDQASPCPQGSRNTTLNWILEPGTPRSTGR